MQIVCNPNIHIIIFSKWWVLIYSCYLSQTRIVHRSEVNINMKWFVDDWHRTHNLFSTNSLCEWHEIEIMYACRVELLKKKKCSKHRMWINQRNSDRDFDRSEKKKRVGMLIRIRNSKTDIWWFLISESQIRVASFALWLRSWNIHSCIQYVCVNDRRVENDWLWYFFSSIHTHISCSDGVLVNQNIYMQKGAWYNLSDDRHVACAHPSQCCMTHVRRNTNTTHKKWTIIGNNNNNNR